METNNIESKKYNMVRVFRLIRANAPLSRKDIEARTGLSWGNVYAICDTLLNRQYLVAEKETSLSGRPPEMLAVNPNRRLSLGIDINSVGLSFSLVNLAGRSVRSIFHPLPSRRREDLLADLLDTSEEILHGSDDVLSISLSMQGKLDRKNGVSVRTSFFEDWNDVPLVKLFAEKFSLPTLLYHDPECLLTFHLLNDARLSELNSIIMVRVDEGIGFAQLLNGKMYDTSNASACELGHTIIIPHGRPCICGKRGCLEAYASLRGMRWHYADRTGRPAGTFLDALHSGDEAAAEIYAEGVRLFGIALSNLFTLLAPDAVLLDGIVFDEIPLFFEDLKKSTYEFFGGACNLLRAVHRRGAPAVGASILTIEKNLESIILDDQMCPL